MTDLFGREINYLRISVTQRCNLNCVYCGSELPSPDVLKADEIVKLATAFSKCGFDKIRLTGGEPLMRTDIAEIASGIYENTGISNLGITTNGILLSKYAYKLKKAGISTVNVSLDALDREVYKKITGKDGLERVSDGIKSAQDAGLNVKINSVLIKGKNDNEAQNLIYFAKDNKIDVRFIELMPFSDTASKGELTVTGKEILERFPFLTPAESEEKSVAKYYTADGFCGRIGLITPISDNFCGSCNRVRLLFNGRLRPCLGHSETTDLMPYIEDEEKLIGTIKQAVFNKPVGHNFYSGGSKQRAMNKIGG